MDIHLKSNYLPIFNKESVKRLKKQWLIRSTLNKQSSWNWKTACRYFINFIECSRCWLRFSLVLLVGIVNSKLLTPDCLFISFENVLLLTEIANNSVNDRQHQRRCTWIAKFLCVDVLLNSWFVTCLFISKNHESCQG